MRTVRIVLWALVIVLGATTAGVWFGQTFLAGERSATAGGLAASFARSRYDGAGGPFTLVNTDGATVTEADLRGKPTALLFGFTHCPDVCPTAMVDAAGWLQALGEKGDDINMVFVSVDPERDRPANLKQYLGAFDPRIIGLTAEDPAAIAAVAEAYNVTFEKVPFENGGYTMNHTADTLLFDAEGNYVDFIPYMPPNIRANGTLAEAEADRTLNKLRALVGA